jgi:hypothetical protein
MADDRRAPHSLDKQSADQIRNEQRGGAGTPVDPKRDGGPEGNASMRQVWSEPGGEAYNYRQSRTGQTSQAGLDGHDELTAAETPETTKHLSDASLSPQDKDATAEAIERATASTGADEDEHAGGERAATPTTHTLRNPGGLASNLQRGGTVPGGGPGGSVGSIGTGGGSTAGSPTGSAKRRI